MKALRRILGILVMIAGILGLVLSLAGLAGVWMARSTVASYVEATIVTLDDRMRSRRCWGPVRIQWATRCQS
jgi:hypothetical protein